MLTADQAATMTAEELDAALVASFDQGREAYYATKAIVDAAKAKLMEAKGFGPAGHDGHVVHTAGRHTGPKGGWTEIG